MDKTFVYKDFIESVPWWVLDQTLNMTPWINILWWCLKNAINWSKNMRIIRWIEFFETIWLYPEFLKELESSEQALDWLAICFEAYIKERNKEKREIIKNIFLWFTELPEDEKEKFELEKLINTINVMSLNDITVFKELCMDKRLYRYVILDENIWFFPEKYIKAIESWKTLRELVDLWFIKYKTIDENNKKIWIWWKINEKNQIIKYLQFLWLLISEKYENKYKEIDKRIKPEKNWKYLDFPYLPNNEYMETIDYSNYWRKLFTYIKDNES